MLIMSAFGVASAFAQMAAHTLSETIPTSAARSRVKVGSVARAIAT